MRNSNTSPRRSESGEHKRELRTNSEISVTVWGETSKRGELSPPKGLSKSIYEDVRERICTLRYPSGQVLSEAELAKEFSVSRTPIREVLQRLQFEGFVEIKHGVGTIVTGFDFRAFKDVYELRLNLVEAIGRLRPRICSDTHRSALEALLERATKLKSERDTNELWRINNERHRIITQLIGNSALRLMYDYFFHLTIRAWFELVTEMWDDQVDALCTELSDLIRAMKFGDTEAVAHVERNHLSYHMALIGRFVSGKPGNVAFVER